MDKNNEKRRVIVASKTVPFGKPDAGKSHARFAGGEVASEQPRRGAQLYDGLKDRCRLLGIVAFVCALAGASVALAANQYHWVELIGFDNTARDYGVAGYLSRLPVRPKAVSLLLTDPEIVHSHHGLAEDFAIGDQQCSYCARPWNEERRRQSWTAWQLRALVSELRRNGVAAYPSFFDVSMSPNSSYLRRFNACRRPGFWIDSHPEVFCQDRTGRRHDGVVCIIKRLSDGSSYADFFIPRLVTFLKDYGFAGWHACDGYGHPRLPVSQGDFSDDVVAQFMQANPEIALPDKLDLSERADWILRNARLAWCRFYAQRNAEFIARAAKALKAEGLPIWLNTCWTCDPFEALYRYGEDYRLLVKAGIGGFFSEASATVLTLEGWGRSEISKLDLCRAALLRTAGCVRLPIVDLACVKDGMEQYNSLRHAPELATAEMLGLQSIHRGDRRVMGDVLWCLTDAIRPDEWRRLNSTFTLLPETSHADGLRVVWSDRAHDAELEAYCRDRSPSSYRLLGELLHRGAVLGSCLGENEALNDPTQPLLIINPARFPPDQLDRLSRRQAPVVMFGVGDGSTEFGETPSEPEPASWLDPLPCRRVDEPALERAVAMINALSPVVPEAVQPDLRLVSALAADGTRTVVAINDCNTYLTARVRVRGHVGGVRALTESPSLPVIPETIGNDSLLQAKIPPRGAVAFSMFQKENCVTKRITKGESNL